MSILKEPPPVKFFTAILISERAEVSQILERLELEFGAMDFISPRFSFHQSSYYEEEMGKNLTRMIISFTELIDRQEIVEKKILADTIERELADSRGNRTVNIDPGYIAGEHLILATGKGYYHRPYLGRGVYADLTLVYQNNSFKALEWTYPDYKQYRIQKIFYELRNEYMNKLREGNKI